jgi:hypothetical protein
MVINGQEYNLIKVRADTITTDDYFGKYWILGIHEGESGYGGDTLGFTLHCPEMGESKWFFRVTKSSIVEVWRKVAKVATTENETRGTRGTK